MKTVVGKFERDSELLRVIGVKVERAFIFRATSVLHDQDVFHDFTDHFFCIFLKAVHQVGRAAGVDSEEMERLRGFLAYYVLQRVIYDLSQCRPQREGPYVYLYITVDHREEVLMDEVVVPILRALAPQDSFRVFVRSEPGGHLIMSF